MKDVLIVIDMQKDFIDGALGTEEAVKIVSYVADKIKKYKDAGRPVFFTRDTHFENYMDTFEGKHLPVPHCIKDSAGWQINTELPDEGCTKIDKLTFGYTGWDEIPEIKDAGSYEICGLCTDICVISNALILRALHPDRDILVDAAACAGVTPEAHSAALTVMRSCQIEVRG